MPCGLRCPKLNIGELNRLPGADAPLDVIRKTLPAVDATSCEKSVLDASPTVA